MAERQFKTEEDVYRELGRVLGRAPNETVWGLMVMDRLPGDVISPWSEDAETGSADDAEAAFAELVEKYRSREKFLSESGALNGRRRQVPPPEQTSSAQAAPAIAALSTIMALEAESHPLVVAFRERVLGGSRLQLEEVTAWRLAHELGAGRLIVSRPDCWPPVGARENAWEAQLDAERYASGDLDVEGHESDFMFCVVDVLIHTYGWPHGSEVAQFVLSGEPPHLTFGIGQMRPYERFFPMSAVVHLIVNPQMEPRRLMELYANMRHHYMPPNTRIRPPGEAASRLAVFAARHNDGSTWQDVWASWNAEGGKQYADARSFARDARKAYLMVTGEALEWRASKDNGPSR